MPKLRDNYFKGAAPQPSPAPLSRYSHRATDKLHDGSSDSLLERVICCHYYSNTLLGYIILHIYMSNVVCIE